MWPSLTTYITEILKKPKSQVPTSSSFSTVKSAVLNKLTTAKLEFFMSIAAAMRQYLQTFQPDGPLLPFITSELETLLWTLMGKFMKRAVLEGANSAYKIAKAECVGFSYPCSTLRSGHWFCCKDNFRESLQREKD